MEDSFSVLTKHKKNSHGRRQSLPVQLEDFQQQHGISRPRVSRNAAKTKKSSFQNHMPAIKENTVVGNVRRKNRLGRRQSLSVLDTKKFQTNLKHFQNVITSDESEDEFPDYLATIPKIRHKATINFCKEDKADPLKKITRRIFVELDEDCDGYLDKNDVTKVFSLGRN